VTLYHPWQGNLEWLRQKHECRFPDPSVARALATAEQKKMTLSTWLVFAATSALLILSPGQTVLFVIGHTLASGHRHAVPMALGVMTGNAVAMTVCFAGVGALLTANDYAFIALRWAGACYLIFLGVRFWRRSPNVEVGSTSGRRGPFLQTFLLMVLNPNALTFFIALAPQFLDLSHSVIPQLATMEATFVLLSGVNILFYSFATNALRLSINNPTALTYLNRAAGLALITIASLAVLAR